MNKAITWLYGAGIGAGLMYVFDPERGRRRRALARDQIVRTWRSTDDLIDKATSEGVLPAPQTAPLYSCVAFARD